MPDWAQQEAIWIEGDWGIVWPVESPHWPKEGDVGNSWLIYATTVRCEANGNGWALHTDGDGPTYASDLLFRKYKAVRPIQASDPLAALHMKRGQDTLVVILFFERGAMLKFRNAVSFSEMIGSDATREQHTTAINRIMGAKGSYSTE